MRTTGIRTSRDRTSGGPPVCKIGMSYWCQGWQQTVMSFLIFSLNCFSGLAAKKGYGVIEWDMKSCLQTIVHIHFLKIKFSQTNKLKFYKKVNFVRFYHKIIIIMFLQIDQTKLKTLVNNFVLPWNSSNNSNQAILIPWAINPQ